MNLRKALAPPAEVSKVDTGLRFTDILFGFVIRELFLRLQNWSDLPGFVRWQLIVGTALVLGSWIGFRRSLNRQSYEVKFFNLPFFKFGLDQIMVILYFRVAVLTDNPYKPINEDDLAQQTFDVLVFVFILYLAWDLLGIMMAKVKDDSGWKYGKVTDGKSDPSTPSRQDWPAVAITSACLVLVGLLLLLLDRGTIGPTTAFVLGTAVLVVYRFAKEIKNTWVTSG